MCSINCNQSLKERHILYATPHSTTSVLRAWHWDTIPPGWIQLSRQCGLGTKESNVTRGSPLGLPPPLGLAAPTCPCSALCTQGL